MLVSGVPMMRKTRLFNWIGLVLITAPFGCGMTESPATSAPSQPGAVSVHVSDPAIEEIEADKNSSSARPFQLLRMTDVTPEFRQ
jgi:hypothetical protein